MAGLSMISRSVVSRTDKTKRQQHAALICHALMKRTITLLAFLLIVPAFLWSQTEQDKFDVLIKGGTVYDGTGGDPIQADVGIKDDRIVAIGKLDIDQAITVVDASGLAVAPGFINMLSWAVTSLIADGRSQSDIRQGVTTEIFGEGTSMGPLNDEMKRRAVSAQRDIKYDIAWTTLAEYLTYLEKRGISPNIASFIGTATIREYVLGQEDSQPTPEQMEQMRELVRREMEDGALGIGSALIYAPGTYARTEELIELCKVAAKYGGKYISHIRSESQRILEAVEELIRISREAGLPAEIYQLKTAGAGNWDKIDGVIARIEKARQEGLKITANMYLYTASSTGLSSGIPAWAHSGGNQALFKRLQEPATRARIAKEMRARGPMPQTLLIGFRSEKLRGLIGKTLSEVAAMRGEDEVDTVLNLVLEDRSRISAVFFLMNENSIKTILRRPWVSIGSDGASLAPEGVFLKTSTHPRAYGNFARLLGVYVRDEKVLTLQEAIRRLTGLPATNLGLDRRGFIREGMYADIVVFDSAAIADRATYEQPHQYAVGVKHVFVNGVHVLRDGEHTGAKPGRALWGPGKVK
jgi:N-acyl-D-amino-acid deacylase